MDDPADRAASSLGERLRRAFSLRRNLRSLLVPVEGHLRPLDGLRALSILWVVLFHAGWYVGLHIPVPMYAALLRSPWMIVVWRGDFGVDAFFVLSGFLIAGMLVDERERHGQVRLGLFYARRMMRLWPALVAAVLVHVALIGDHNEMMWANLLYVSNFIPILDAGMGWTWSLAIEEQFYLVCPWLVRGLVPLRQRARLGVLAGLALALCGVAAWVVVAGRFRAIDSEVVVNRDFVRWSVGYDHLYVKPWMRAGPLLAGVAAAYVFRLRGAMDWLARRRVAPVVVLLVMVALAGVCMHWPLVRRAPRAVEVVYLALYRTGFGVAVAYLLLLSLSRHPVGRALGRALSVRFLYPFGQLAYSAYLLNPIATTLVDRALAPLVWQGKAAPMALFTPFDAAATFLGAAAIHLLVERPFMELRPRDARRTAAAEAPAAGADEARAAEERRSA
jgi:peptidoglycan/LPS O-acetylase OafA/YrhL